MQADAALDLDVFTIVGKTPPAGCKWKEAATKDPVAVAALIDRYPNATGHAVACGERSGVIVVDIDPRHGGHVTLARFLADDDTAERIAAITDPERIVKALLELIDAQGDDWYTAIVVTGSWGLHLYFDYGDGLGLRNGALTDASGKELGIDVKTDGGYVVGRNSIHPTTGRRYQEAEGRELRNGRKPMPSALAAFVKAHQRERAKIQPGQRIPMGVQESTLTRIAGAMRRQGSTEAEILAALRLVSAERCDPPVLEHDLARIARSISSYDAQSPMVTAECTDMGNAERFAYVAAGKAIYCAPLRKWFVWDGRRYREDKTHRIDQLAEDTVRLTGIAAFNMLDGQRETAEQQETRETLQRWAMASQSARRLSDMVSLARGKLAVLPEQLDADPLKLCVLNGVIDLTTGDLLPHDPAYLMTKLAPVEYDPAASLPEFDAFLADTTAGKEGLCEFLQQALGYSITGDIREEKLFMPLGPSRTGKSTLIEAVKKALGDYAETANFHTFIRKHSESTASEDVARLAGMRFVSSIEVDDGKALAEALVKQMTGGDTIAARKLYQDTFAFTPTHKLWLVANHEPKVSQDDTAMWERILRLPFENVVPPERRDPTLKARLTNPDYAGPAIMAWLVKGALAWQAAGKLVVPEVVSKATADYRDRMDPVTPFLEECCELDPDAKLPAGDLWSAYLGYCKTYRLKPIRQRDWVDKLKGHGIEPAKSNGQRLYRGVKLAMDEV